MIIRAGLGAVAVLLAACSTQTSPSPARPATLLRYDQPVSKLVTPVSALPGGTRVRTEGDNSAEDIGALWPLDPPLTQRLADHGFIAAYSREFVIPKGAALLRIWSTVLLFADPRGASDVLQELGDWLEDNEEYGRFAPAAFGDGGRALAGDRVARDATGRSLDVTDVRILFRKANVLVIISQQADPTAVDRDYALEVAKFQAEHLRAVAPR